MIKKILLLKNRLVLKFLIRLMTKHLDLSKAIRKRTNPGSMWLGTQTTDDKLLNQCLKVLKRRLQESS